MIGEEGNVFFFKGASPNAAAEEFRSGPSLQPPQGPLFRDISFLSPVPSRPPPNSSLLSHYQTFED